MIRTSSSVSRARLKGNIDWTFGGGGYRHIWMHKNSGLFFGAAKESDAGDSGLQNASTAVVEVIVGDYFELIVRQTSGSTKNVAADELTWFAIEVWSRAPAGRPRRMTLIFGRFPNASRPAASYCSCSGRCRTTIQDTLRTNVVVSMHGWIWNTSSSPVTPAAKSQELP